MQHIWRTHAAHQKGQEGQDAHIRVAQEKKERGEGEGEEKKGKTRARARLAKYLRNAEVARRALTGLDPFAVLDLSDLEGAKKCYL